MPTRRKRNSNTTSGTASRTDLQAYLKERGRETRLVEANEQLARELIRAKGRTADLVEAVRRAVTDAATGLVLPPVVGPSKVLRRVARTRDAEKALVVVSDVQLGKATPSYNTKVAEERLAAYAEKVCSLAAIQRADHPVDEARVYLLGDIVEGELIFPSQPHETESSLYRQTVVDGPRILVNFLRRLLLDFRTVHVVGVIGNHGALGGPVRRQYNPETNADRMLYEFIRQLMRDESRCTWNIPFELNHRAWYAVDYPFGEDRMIAGNLLHGHGFLLFHGDQIPGSANYSMKTIANRIWGWASGAVPEPFDHVIYGHWHSPRYFEAGRYSVWCNGSTESDNRFAQERLSAMGKPTQLLLFVHPRKGVTSEYWVRL